MNEQEMRYIIDNQSKWRQEYIEQRSVQKKIRKMLGRQYEETKNKKYPKERIKQELIELLCLNEEEIKENENGYLYVDYCCTKSF